MEDEDWNRMKNKYEQAVESFKDLDPIIYQSFINISEHLKFQMNFLSQQIEKLDTKNYTVKEMTSLTTSLKTIFSRDASILRSCMFFCLFFPCYRVKVTWLDEIAEGLRNLIQAINSVVLTF